MNINNEYFDWMYNLVCDGNEERLSYRRLLNYLNNVDFLYINDRDANRATDGINFRYRFGYEFGYSNDIISRELDTRPCSVLEMMVSLAFRVEEQIMCDSDYGDRTSQWFWNMIVSLGLGTMNDDDFDRSYAEEIIYRFMNRDYKPNGEGGLFTLSNAKEDLRNVEIWYQMMWYLDENYDMSL